MPTEKAEGSAEGIDGSKPTHTLPANHTPVLMWQNFMPVNMTFPTGTPYTSLCPLSPPPPMFNSHADTG
jgi:hypothetical protein